MRDEPEAPTFKLILWMTREEFLTTWAYQFVAENWNAYGADQIPEDAREQIFGSVGVSLKFAAAKLQHEHRFTYTGFDISEDGVITPKQPEPVEPRNELYLYRFANGMWPHPLGAVETAIRTLKDAGAKIDLEAFYEARKQLQRDFQAAREHVMAHPEETIQAGEIMEKLMNRAGYFRADRGEPN